MKKLLLSLIVLTATALHIHAQQYPNVYVNAGPDQVLPCGATCTTLSATYLPSFTTPAGTLYRDTPIAYTPFSYLNGIIPPQPFQQEDDEYSNILGLPFYFCFFGNGYDKLILGNNGMISFDLTNAGLSNPWPLSGQGTIPSSSGSFANDLNSIMGPYMDVIPGELPTADSNYVNCGVFGTAPNRRFVMSYYKVPFFDVGICPGDDLTSQMVLYETTNVIDIYIGNKPSCSGWNGGLAVEGIQNSTGTIAYAVPGRNNTVWTATNDGYRFLPQGTINLVSLAWYQGDSVLVGTGDTVSVCPPSNTSTMYVVRATYTDCYTTATVRDTMYTNVTQTAGPVQYLSCPSATASVTMSATGTGAWSALSTNPGPVTITMPASPGTTIVGFTDVGTYRFQWAGGLCVDTATVVVTQRASAGPDQDKCKNDTAIMAAYGTGTWTALPANPSATVIANPALNTTPITGFTAGGAYSFVWTTSPGCTDTMVVNIPFFSLAMTAGSTTVCQYSNTSITVTPSVAGLGPFQYTWLDSSIVSSPHSPTTVIDGIPGSTYFHVQVTSADGCKLEDSILITATASVGTIIKASANPTVVCAGSPAILTVVANPNSCGLATSACTSPGKNVSLGTATTFQTGAGDQYPSPYGNYYASAHHQFLVHASELLSQVPSGGQIKSLSFDIRTSNSGSAVAGFTIKLGCTSADSIDGSFLSSGTMTQVYTTASYQPATGINTHVFATPYDWDGVSNIIVDVCFANNGGGSINPKMYYTTTPFQSVWCTYGNDPGGVCGIIGSQARPDVPYAQLFQRPNMVFNMCITNLAGANLQWTPGTGPDAPTPTNLDTVTAHPVSTTQYEVTLTSANGCINYDYVTVSVDTSSRLAFNNDTFVCSAQPIPLHAVVTGDSVIPANVVYTWTATPATSPVPPSGTGPGFASAVVTPAVSTTYTVSIGGASCALFGSMRVTVGTGLPISATVDSIACWDYYFYPGTIVIHMNAGTAPYTYTWSPSPAANTDSLTGLGPGTYYLTVTDAGGCVGKDTFTLIAPAPLAVTFDSSNIRCHGIDIDTITALVTGGRPPYRYTWSPVAGNTNTLTGLAAGTYNLTVTDTSGCTTPGTVHITQPSQIVSGAASTNLSGFNTDDGTITVTTTGGTGSYTYSSSPAVSGLPDATMLDTGRYIITVCDTNHCCVNDTAYISEPPPIYIVFTVTNNNCYGQCTGTASASATGGVTPYTYAWTTVPATGVIGTAASISQLCAGTYQISVTDANGLHVTKDTTISAPPLLAMAIDSTPITCAGANNGSLKDSVYGGTPPYTITWTPTGNGSTITGLAPGMYIADVTDANGCPAADTAYLGQPTPVVGTLISTDSVSCYNGSNGFANIQATGGRPAYSYSWSGSNSVDSFASNLSAGSGIVTIKDAAGCPATVPYTIYQPNPILVIALDTTAAHCLTSHDGSATATATGGTPPYTYAFDGIATAGVDSVTGLAPGIHTLEIMDSKGCVDTIGDIHFTIGTQYTLSINLQADSATCNGYSNGKAYATALNGTAPYSYQWSPSASTADSATDLAAGPESVIVTDVYGCTATGPVTIGQPNAIIDAVTATNPLCAGQSNGQFSVSAGGTTGPYTYTFAGTVHPITDIITGLDSGTYYLTVTDGKGCTRADSAVLTDPLSLTLPAPVITGISCANEANGSIQLSPQGGTQPYTYSWTPGGYTAAGEDSLPPGTYTIIVTDANGCQISVTDTLSAPPLIYASFIVDSTSCPGAADGHIIVNAGGGTPGNPITYTYSLDGTTYQQGNNFFSLAAGMYQIYVKDSPGCVLDTFTNVYQPLAITAYINPQDSLIALGTSIQLSSLIGNVTTQSINSYAWSPATGLSCLDCPNPIASPYQATQYYLTVNYGKGCTVTDSALIGIGHGAPVYIPDAFTPNGDGTNDNFAVYGTTLYGVGMKVFDRWGEKVFDSGGSQWATWDGTYRGVVQSPGVFTYLIQLTFLDGSQETKQGSVTLIR